MAAYNDVLFEGTCPSCGQVSLMRAQCHVASSFDGDDRGRFCLKEYALGQPMDWWPREHRSFEKWKDADVHIPDLSDPDHVEEDCLLICERCGADLYAVIAFEVNVPVEVREVGLESQGSARYRR